MNNNFRPYCNCSFAGSGPVRPRAGQDPSDRPVSGPRPQLQDAQGERSRGRWFFPSFS